MYDAYQTTKWRSKRGRWVYKFGVQGRSLRLKTKIWELSIYKKTFKDISLDEITNRLSTDKRREKISNAEPRVILIFGNRKEKEQKRKTE